MAKAIVIYGSTTGNTEQLSEEVAKGLRNGGMEVTVMDVAEANVNELTDFDLIVLGCSTWGDGELQDDFVDFYDAMTKESFAGKKTAVFGPGDSEEYPDYFCEAVVIIEKKLREYNAEIVAESFKVDGDIEPEADNAKEWGLKVAESI